VGRKRTNTKYLYVAKSVLNQAKAHSIWLLFQAEKGCKSLIFNDVSFSKSIFEPAGRELEMSEAAKTV
jgi:hypothetical protein